MKVEHVKGNTWTLIDWEYIPFYKVDDSHCILLDTGTHEQREDLENTLLDLGLTPIGMVGSHAHIDHMGSFAYFQQKYGAKLALTLGEAGQIYSHIGLHLQYNNLALEEFPKYPELYTAPCLPDIIVLPGETEVEVCGVTFGLVRTPGHTVDHVCIRTPDNVLYLGDAMMTGRTLHRSKFPYAFDVGVYLDSLGKLRMAEADKFIVAHQGVYDEILPFIDLELRFMTTRMLELLDLVPPDGFTTPKLAFYMKLPQPGKARDYMMVMRTAAQMFADRLGGSLQDNSGRPLTSEILDKMEEDFRKYDGQDPDDAGRQPGQGAPRA